MNNLIKLLTPAGMMLMLAACNGSAERKDEVKASQQENHKESLLDAANSTFALLEKGQFDSLRTQGEIRFSPYSHVDTATQVKLTPLDLKRLWHDTARLQWGYYDGSGQPIRLSVREYFKQFVSDRNFRQADTILQNAGQAKGNIRNNIPEAYPDAEYVEYYFKADNGQMNWEALTLIFRKHEDHYNLVGVVHGQWTI
jgi:hypothetical protein